MARPRGIEIVRRAYELWEQAGKPDGQDQEFYHQAERELTEGLAVDCGERGSKELEEHARVTLHIQLQVLFPHPRVIEQDAAMGRAPDGAGEASRFEHRARPASGEHSKLNHQNIRR